MRDVTLATCALAIVTLVAARHPETTTLLLLPVLACVCLLAVALINHHPRNARWSRK